MLQSATECYKVLKSVTEYYRVWQSVTDRVLQIKTKASLGHLLGPIFGLVFKRKWKDNHYDYYNHYDHYNHYRDSDLDLDWERFSELVI